MGEREKKTMADIFLAGQKAGAKVNAGIERTAARWRAPRWSLWFGGVVIVILIGKIIL